MKTEFERWGSKVNKTSGCWEWTGAKYRSGYGHFRRYINGKWKMYKAHRFAYEYFNSTDLLDSKVFVCHSCDNPSCVNPDHLFVGSNNDNVQDKMQKGRHGYGICKEHNALSEDKIKTIRKLRSEGLTYREISDIVGTSAPQAHRIATYKTHKDVRGG